MSYLSPKKAAELARDIYLVHNPDSLDLELFLRNDVFTRNTQNKKIVSAKVGTRLINATDAFGLCAAGAKSENSHSNFSEETFLIFRGSTSKNYGADWFSNARIGIETSRTGSKVHIGFHSIFLSMLADLKTFLDSHTDSQKVIHCIGHSLGGAVATLASDWVKHFYPQSQVRLYTFGAPRPGGHEFSLGLTSKLGIENIFRVHHESDPVPMVPIFPFTHPPAGKFGYFIQTKPVIWPWDHKMGKYFESVENLPWSMVSPFSTTSIADRELEKQIYEDKWFNPKAVSTWRWLESALAYVIRKIVGGLLTTPQLCAIGAITIADRVALILKNGLDNSDDDNGAGGVGALVFSLMKKIMQVIGMAIVATRKALTKSLMEAVLNRLIERNNYEARRAIMSLAV